MESLINSIISFFYSFLNPKLIIFLISLTPVLELRGGLIAASALGVDWRIALIICIVGNLIPIPFIMLFIKKIFEKLKNTRFVKFIDKLEAKAASKVKSIEKYETLGLFLFVAIPLPGTGAWTGALIASLFDMPFKKSMISISCGVITAGIIMSVLSYGIMGFLK